ncbi:MAG: DUF418 domain-containing protein [Bacteroidales bacterium]|nr:DUF418 domain-containing protein [Bacteroidales bacterium]
MNNLYNPVAPTKRIELLDILRGFAIFGILMVNIPLMYEPITKLFLETKEFTSVTQQMLDYFITFFFKGKFYLIFSLLFGYGFWLFMNKKTEQGKNIVPLFSKRLFFLLLFGIAHVVFLWAGDILVVYALYGFLLILFRHSSNRKMRNWSIIFLLIPIIFMTFSVLSTKSVALAPPEAQEQIMARMDASFEQQAQHYQQIIDQATTAYSSGSYSEMIVMRLREYQTMLPSFIFAYSMVFGMFLLGVIIAKKGYISDYHNHLPTIRKTFWWCLVLGLVANTFYLYFYQTTSMTSVSFASLWLLAGSTFGGIAFAFCYACGIILLYNRGMFASLFRLLADTGRMALSNYLGQSIICAIIFLGFGWFGKLVLWQSVLMTLTLFIAQMFFSRWWLSKFNFGPMEWLWRCLTYGKMPTF